MLQALCNAVEHEKLEKAKSILEQHPDLRLDGINGDGFTPLDLVRLQINKYKIHEITKTTLCRLYIKD
jgi:hypothetical protein